MQGRRAAAGVLQSAALLACFLGSNAASQGFISVSNGAFVDANCTEFIPVGWNSCDLHLPHPCRLFLECAVRFRKVPSLPDLRSLEAFDLDIEVHSVLDAMSAEALREPFPWLSSTACNS